MLDNISIDYELTFVDFCINAYKLGYYSLCDADNKKINFCKEQE